MTLHPPRFTPSWWLPDAHSQTIWGRLFKKVPSVRTRDILLETPDGDILEIVRYDPPESAGAGASQSGVPPRLVILHGLEGGAHSHYVRGLLWNAKLAGWGADLLLFRSCGRLAHRAPRSYHSGETGDLHFLLSHLRGEFPEAPLVAAGVSLGGNVLLKWLGEMGESAAGVLSGAATISVPYDLSRATRKINRGFSRIYQRVFLRTLVRKAAELRGRHPGVLPGVELVRITSLEEFDELVTAPLHGFAGSQDYYTRSSSLRFLEGVRVPTLLLSAVDDPFLPAAVLDEVRRLASPSRWLRTEFHPHGGHAGFVGGANPFRPFYYAEWRVCDFLAGLLSGRGDGKSQII